MDIVYSFMYCDCIHESASYTVSLHKTKKGAEIAMEFHKAEKKKEFEQMYSKEELKEYGFKFGQMEDWRVVETELNEI